MHAEHEGSSDRPLLVLAGFSPVPVLWAHVVHFYRRRGFDARSFRFRLDDMRDSVTYAQRVASAVRQLSSGGRKVDIVGLSMGGVAALYAMKRLGIAARVGRFVAVAAPFGGTTISFLGLPSLVFSKVGIQLRPGSGFLRELHEDPLPEGPSYAALCGTEDRICPAKTAILPGARNEFIRFSHKDLLISRVLHRHIVECLRRDRP